MVNTMVFTHVKGVRWVIMEFVSTNMTIIAGVLQKDSEKGAVLCLQRRQAMLDRQEAEEQVPVLQVQQVHGHGHEEGGSAGGEAEGLQ